MATTVFSMEYSRMLPPYGWDLEGTWDDSSGTYFYTNFFTGESAWELPAYTFDEYKSAREVQRMWRGQLGKRRFKKARDAFPLAALVEDAIDRASAVGWVGHSYEGMSVEMWLNRVGLSHICQKLEQNTKISRDRKKAWLHTPAAHILQMSSRDQLSKFGIKEKEDQDIVEAFKFESGFATHRTRELATCGNEHFAFLSGPSVANRIFTKAYPNQTMRSDHLTHLVMSCPYPVTIAQVKAHCRRFKGKPKTAQDMIEECLYSARTVSNREDEIKVFRVYLHCAKRAVVLAANLELYTLKAVIQQGIEFVVARTQVPPIETLLSNAGNEDVVGRKPLSISAHTLGHEGIHTRTYNYAVDRSIKGAWDQIKDSAHDHGNDHSHGNESSRQGCDDHSIGNDGDDNKDDTDRSISCVLTVAQGTTVLRREVLGHVAAFVRQTLFLQRFWRGALNRKWWNALMSHRFNAARTIQSLRRCYLSRRLQRIYYAQQSALWEELYDYQSGAVYFFHKPTKRSRWDAPRGPYRPLVNLRGTSRQISAWPCLDRPPSPTPEARARQHLMKVFLTTMCVFVSRDRRKYADFVISKKKRGGGGVMKRRERSIA
jgi:hypothetical protein